MANRTVKDAKNIHGTNPQYLIEKIIRSRIYDSKFWKEQCFALTAELLVDKGINKFQNKHFTNSKSFTFCFILAMEIRFTGGVYGSNIRPTPFLCLTLKMLQIQPEKDIVVEFIKNEEFKYVRALGAFYLRLTGTSVDCYKYLEPLYNDNRKLRHQNRAGNYEIIHMDEFIDQLLREDRVCDIILPRIQKRCILEENNELEPKVSALDDDLEGSDDDEDDADDNEGGAGGGGSSSRRGRSDADERIRDDGYEKKKHKKDSDRKESDRHSDRRDSDRRKAYDGRKSKSDKYGDRDYDRDRDRYESRYESSRSGRDRERERERDRDRSDRDRSDRKRSHRDYDDYEYDSKRRH